MNNGRVIGARMALCTVGVRPSTAFLEESGITIDENTGAITVSLMMQTNVPEIYAVDGFIAGTWAQSAR